MSGKRSRQQEVMTTKEFGKFWAVLTTLQTFVRATWMNLGIIELFDILDWLNKAGQEDFFHALQKLALRYRQTIQKVLEAEVPFYGAIYEEEKQHLRMMTIKVKGGELFIGGAKASSWPPLPSWERWEDLFTDNNNRPALNPGFRDRSKTVRDFLLENPEFFPKAWVRNTARNQVILFPDPRTRTLYGIERETATGKLDDYLVYPYEKPLDGQRYIILH